MSDKLRLLTIGIFLAIAIISAVLAINHVREIESFWEKKISFEMCTTQLTGEEVILIRKLYTNFGVSVVFLIVFLVILANFLIDLAWERTKRS